MLVSLSPFEVFLKNQSDMILKEQAATLGFRYRDDDGAIQEETQNELLSALSLVKSVRSISSKTYLR